MVEQHLKPSYNEIMRGLGIEIINPNKAHICNFVLVNRQKEGLISIKTQKIKGLGFKRGCAYYLRFQEGFFNIQIYSIISLNQENRRIYE